MQFKVEKNNLRRIVLQLLQNFSGTDFQKNTNKKGHHRLGLPCYNSGKELDCGIQTLFAGVREEKE